MSFSENGTNGFYMPVAPAYGGNGGAFGNGWNSDFWFLFILLFAFGGFGGYGMGGFGGGALGYDFPWLLNGQNGINANTNAGFNQAATQNALNGIQSSITSGFGDVQLGIAGVNQNICQTGNGIVSAITNGFANAEVADNARQVANMQTAFASQTAMNQGFNGVQASLASASADNRLGIADLKYTVATENCADRTTSTQNTQAIIAAVTAGVQSIKDQIFQDKMDAKDDIIAQLRQENMYARGQASQVEQTAAILANNNAQTALFQQGLNNEVDALYNRLNNCPVPTTPVYGRTPIFTCNNQPVYGCQTCGM